MTVRSLECRAQCMPYGWTSQSQIDGFLQCMKTKRLGWNIEAWSSILQSQYRNHRIVVVVSTCVTVFVWINGRVWVVRLFIFFLHMPEPSKRKRLVLQSKNASTLIALYIIAKLLDCYCYNFKRFLSYSGSLPQIVHFPLHLLLLIFRGMQW